MHLRLSAKHCDAARVPKKKTEKLKRNDENAKTEGGKKELLLSRSL